MHFSMLLDMINDIRSNEFHVHVFTSVSEFGSQFLKYLGGITARMVSNLRPGACPSLAVDNRIVSKMHVIFGYAELVPKPSPMRYQCAS